MELRRAVVVLLTVVVVVAVVLLLRLGPAVAGVFGVAVGLIVRRWVRWS